MFPYACINYLSFELTPRMEYELAIMICDRNLEAEAFMTALFSFKSDRPCPQNQLIVIARKVI